MMIPQWAHGQHRLKLTQVPSEFRPHSSPSSRLLSFCFTLHSSNFLFCLNEEETKTYPVKKNKQSHLQDRARSSRARILERYSQNESAAPAACATTEEGKSSLRCDSETFSTAGCFIRMLRSFGDSGMRRNSARPALSLHFTSFPPSLTPSSSPSPLPGPDGMDRTILPPSF